LKDWLKKGEKMTQPEAILKSLEDTKEPMTGKELTDHIIREKYYDFGDAPTPSAYIQSVCLRLYKDGVRKGTREGKGNLYYWLTKYENSIEDFDSYILDDSTEHDKDEVKKNDKYEERRNLIYFGAPGTGKSHTLDSEANRADRFENIERVTFHPNYSYTQFVGCYKPVPKDEETITYEFIPGPFIRMLIAAKNDPKKKHLLIIEEINRANPAAIFGDVFQLLDRDDNGESEYGIAPSEDLREYLHRKLDKCDKHIKKDECKNCKEIKIPNNLYIWATMNSADQGVFPMDTAFKRRWDFEYIGIDDGVDKGDIDPEWDEVRRAINQKLQELGVNEDKWIGPFFLGRHFKFDGDNSSVNSRKFMNKLLMYLYEDAGKFKHDELFGKKSISLSEVFENFKANEPETPFGLKISYQKTQGSGEENNSETENDGIPINAAE
jgi:hypothetical protein